MPKELTKNEREIDEAIATAYFEHLAQCSLISPTHMFEMGFLKGMLFAIHRADQVLSKVLDPLEAELRRNAPNANKSN